MMYSYGQHMRYDCAILTTNLLQQIVCWQPLASNQLCWVNRRDYGPGGYCCAAWLHPMRKPEKMMPRHNTNHRNSSSSDAAASDDLNSSSSNDDLSTTYAVIAQAGKKSTKSRQKRQQKRKQQANNANANNNNNSSSSSAETHNGSGGNRNRHNEGPTPMDIDEESKENQPPMQPGVNGKSGMPQSGNSATGSSAKSAGGVNLRKQCTKAAAFKAVNKPGKGAISKCTAANTLSTSASNSSVCSALSSASSTLSISSSASSSTSSSPTNSAHCSPTASPTVSKRNIGYIKKAARVLATATATTAAPTRSTRIKLHIPEHELAHHLHRYIIDPNLLRVYGYPVESAVHEGCVEVYKCLPRAFGESQPPPPPPPAPTHQQSQHNHQHHQRHNPNNTNNKSNRANVINEDDGLAIDFRAAGASAKEWSNSGDDSGQGSGECSPPSLDSDASEVGEDEPAAGYVPDGSYPIFSEYDQSFEKQCSRCNRMFHVTESGEYLSYEPCTFHWGKITNVFTQGIGYNYRYTCCRADLSSAGCSRNSLHVWTGSVVGLNGPYTDFVHTRPRHSSVRNRSVKVFALDCEMSFTGRGLEVTKVTVVGHDGELVYEHFVRPPAEIVDYNTRFSGVTEKDLHGRAHGSVKTLQEVQRDLLQMIDADTILIGHGLDNDLRVLRIVHKTVIDTSISFPHASGFPYRRALKNLARSCLSREIQQSEDGHSSFEDSRTCLELMLWKVQTEILDGMQH